MNSILQSTDFSSLLTNRGLLVRRPCISVLVLLFFSLFSAMASTWRIEAEQFPMPKAWKVSFDQQASNGKIMMASESSENEIETTVQLPEAGSYILWARSATFGENYRQYRVSINGQTSSVVFGDESPIEGRRALVFAKGDMIKLDAGPARISILPKSPYARCDLLVLTTDSAFVPSNDRKQIEKIPVLKSVDVAVSTSAVQTDIQRVPGSILLLHGGRPWMASDTTGILKRAGAQVETLDSTLLDGLGGASIKDFLTDKNEPVAKDGITPAFERLSQYSLVAILAIPRDNLQKLLTPVRLAQIETYVKNGGALLVTENAPDVLADLLPVQLGESVSRDFTTFTCTNAHAWLAGIPERWPYFGSYRKVKAKSGVEILVAVQDKEKKDMGPLIVLGRLGKGQVLYWNSEIGGVNGIRQLRCWAYFGKILVRLFSNLAGVKLNDDKVLYQRASTPAVESVKKAKVSIHPPSFKESRPAVDVKAQIKTTPGGWKVKFSNQVYLDIQKASACATVSYPGLSSGGLNELRPPVPVVSTADPQGSHWDASTAEATPVASHDEKVKMVSTEGGIEEVVPIDSGGISLKFSSVSDQGVRYAGVWELVPGEFTIHGTRYVGFGDRVEIVTCDRNLETLRSTYGACLGSSIEGHSAWRMACYGTPRGFDEVLFSKSQTATTGTWEYFFSGQPFTWLSGPDGILLEFMDTPYVDKTSISYVAGQDRLKVSHELLVGNRKSPLKAPLVWHVYSKGTLGNTNAWMGAYQYLRMRYRNQFGIDPGQPLPTSSYANTCTPDERLECIRTSARTAERYSKQQTSEVLRVCCVCHAVEHGNVWCAGEAVEEGIPLSHGFCPSCFADAMSQVLAWKKSFSQVAVAN